MIPILLLATILQQVPPANSTRGSNCPPQLESTIKDYERALAKKEASMLKAILAEEFQLITASGKILKKADMLANLGKMETQYESFESTAVQFTRLGNTVVETGKVRTKGMRGGKPIDETTLYTDVWIEHEGKWLLLAEHSSFPAS